MDSCFNRSKLSLGNLIKFDGSYFFGNLKFDRKRQGPLCQRKTKDAIEKMPRDATLQKFMVASMTETFRPKADETLVPSLSKGSIYLLAIVRLVDNGYVNQLCIFESFAPAREQSANSNATGIITSEDEDTVKSEESSKLSNAAVTGIVLAVVAAVAIGAAMIIVLFQRLLGRRQEKMERPSVIFSREKARRV